MYNGFDLLIVHRGWVLACIPMHWSVDPEDEGEFLCASEKESVFKHQTHFKNKPESTEGMGTNSDEEMCQKYPWVFFGTIPSLPFNCKRSSKTLCPLIASPSLTSSQNSFMCRTFSWSCYRISAVQPRTCVCVCVC